MEENLQESLTPESLVVVQNALDENIPDFIRNPQLPKYYMNEVQQPCRDGRIIWVEVSTKYRYNQDGDIEVVGVSRYIEDRKKMEIGIRESEAELRKINAEKDKFFSIIAHDLRSPFNIFLGFTRMMVEDLHSMRLDEIQQIAMTMRNSATNLYRLLENLLDWSRMQQGLIPFNLEILHLLSIAEDSITLITEPAKNKGIEIYCEIPDDLTVYADSNILQTVIRNLLSNAVKFTTRGGSVSLSAKNSGDGTVEISVRDSGIGMDRQTVENLFRLDVQTTRKGTDNEPSSGLGLLLCREFVEKHGGHIQVESEEGKGSNFRFSLPSNPHGFGNLEGLGL
jgi:signal transduction histidine kinase